MAVQNRKYIYHNISTYIYINNQDNFINNILVQPMDAFFDIQAHVQYMMAMDDLLVNVIQLVYNHQHQLYMKIEYPYRRVNTSLLLRLQLPNQHQLLVEKYHLMFHIENCMYRLDLPPIIKFLNQL